MRKNKDLFSIFPVDAGVNLIDICSVIGQSNIPRGCGGEPIGSTKKVRADAIFPVDAGVNPFALYFTGSTVYIPRGCGGER